MSTSKAVYTIFNNRNYNMNNQIQLTYNNKQLKGDPNPKFLGVILDPGLRMHKHSDYLVTRTQKRLNLLRNIKGKNWGASSKTIMNTYKALIRPIIEYVPFITLSTAKSNFNKLENIQRKAIRVAIPWPPHT